MHFRASRIQMLAVIDAVILDSQIIDGRISLNREEMKYPARQHLL
jgi:hypothetical protein